MLVDIPDKALYFPLTEVSTTFICHWWEDEYYCTELIVAMSVSYTHLIGKIKGIQLQEGTNNDKNKINHENIKYC